MEGLRVAVVGCGYWGSKHVRVLHSTEGVQQVVAVDSSPRRVSTLTRTLPGVVGAGALEDVLDDVDAVVVATPPSGHLPLGLQALEAGKHVLVEKPLTPTVAEARQLVDAADRAGRVLMVGHTYEFNPVVWELATMVRSGELGDLYYFDAARLNLGLYQSDVNVILDLAPHDISISNRVVGGEPVWVEAWGSTHAHPDLEDVAYIRIQYANPDVVANIHVSWLDPHKVRRVTVVGSKKMAVFNDMAPEERLRIFDKGVEAPASDTEDFSQPPMSYRYGNIVTPYIEGKEPLALEDAHFVDSILTNSTPLTDGRSGLRVVQVLEAAQRSLHERRRVTLDELESGARSAPVVQQLRVDLTSSESVRVG